MPVQIRSVLFASDLSESSDDVLRGAAQIAELAGAELHAVHVEESAGLYPGIGEPLIDMQRRMQEARLKLMEQLQRTGVGRSVNTARMVFGPAHRGILERAREVSADLIVIGPHRGGSLGDRILGTTADRLIRTSDVPCLIVRGPMSLPLRRVLVPSDLSQPAQIALTEAFAWAAALGVGSTSEGREPTEVHVLHVIPLPSEFTPTAMNREYVETQLREQIDAARAGLPGDAAVTVRHEVLPYTSPVGEILRIAKAGTDLLVMGTHGRGAVGRALVGSVTSAVARQAECPILLVPPTLDVADRGDAGALAEAVGAAEGFSLLAD